VTCECGCGEILVRGFFLPGHDQRLRSLLEQRVGGLLPLRTLVDSAERLAHGEITPEEDIANVRGVFDLARPAPR
jgi:hypothetical protein